MASVAELLMQHAEQVGRARMAQGAIWGNAVAGLGEIPRQLEQQKVVDQELRIRNMQEQSMGMSLREQQDKASANGVWKDVLGSTPNQVYDAWNGTTQDAMPTPAPAPQPGPPTTVSPVVLPSFGGPETGATTTPAPTGTAPGAPAPPPPASDLHPAAQGIRTGFGQLYNLPAIAARIAADPRWPASVDPTPYLARLEALNSSFQQFQDAKIKMVQLAFRKVADLGNDPEHAMQVLGQLAANGAIDPQEAQHYISMIKLHPEIVPRVSSALLGPQYMKIGEGEKILDVNRGFQEVATGGEKMGADVKMMKVNGRVTPVRTTATGMVNGLTGQPIPANATVEEHRPETWTTETNVTIDGQQVPVQTSSEGRVRRVDTGEIVQGAKLGVFHQPPAQVQLFDWMRNKAANAPAVDPTRPAPDVANQVDPDTGLTKMGLWQEGLKVALTNRTSAVGAMGNSPRADITRKAITNLAGAIAAAAGTDETTLQADYAALTGANKKAVDRAFAVGTAARTANDFIKLAVDASAKEPRTGAKLVNRFWQWSKGELSPATGLSTLEAYSYSAAREYAKVVTGSAQSVAEVTNKAAEMADRLLNAARAHESYSAVATAMQNDMAKVVGEQQKTVRDIGGSIANLYRVTTGAEIDTTGGETTPPPAVAGPKLGDIRENPVTHEQRRWNGTMWAPFAPK
jgi:hypothetical protein